MINRAFTAIIAILLLAAAFYGQTAAERVAKFEKPKDYVADYDKFKGKSTIYSQWQTTETGKGRKNRALLVNFTAIYDGDAEPENVSYYIAFRSPASRFDYNIDAILLADSERIVLAKGSTNNDVRTSGYGRYSGVVTSGRVVFAISADDLRSLASATTAEVQVARLEAVLGSDVKRTIREMLSLADTR